MRLTLNLIQWASPAAPAVFCVFLRQFARALSSSLHSSLSRSKKLKIQIHKHKNFASSQFFWANPPSVVWLTLELEPKASENRAVSHYTLLIVSDLSWPRGAGRHCECEYMLYTCMSSFIRRDCNRQSNLSYYWALSTVASAWKPNQLG